MNPNRQLNDMYLKLLNIENDLFNMKLEVWDSGESPLYCKKYEDSIESIQELVRDASNRIEYVKWRIDQLNKEKEAKV